MSLSVCHVEQLSKAAAICLQLSRIVSETCLRLTLEELRDDGSRFKCDEVTDTVLLVALLHPSVTKAPRRANASLSVTQQRRDNMYLPRRRCSGRVWSWAARKVTCILWDGCVPLAVL